MAQLTPSHHVSTRHRPDTTIDVDDAFAVIIAELPATRVSVWMGACHACERPNTLWWAVDITPLWARTRIEAHPLVIDAVALHTLGGVPLANIGWVVTAEAGGYVGFSCPRTECRQIQGDWFVYGGLTRAVSAGATTTVTVPL